jgi:anti-sigma factor RsiW
MTQITEAEIQGYIDGELDAEERARVERCCEERPDIARRIRETRQDMALLRRHFTAAWARVPDRHIAETVRLIADYAPPPRKRVIAGLRGSLRSAAMIALIVAGAAGVLGIKLSMTVPAYADAAALAYLDLADDPPVLDEDGILSPQALIDWINANTGLTVRAPHAEEHGFHLSDGRLARFDSHAAGVLVYEDGQRHRVAIYMTRLDDGEEEQRHFAVDRSVYINYWAHKGIGIVIAAADRQDLDKFTSAIERQIHVSSRPAAAR